MDKKLRNLTSDLAAALTARRLMLGTAESCTGGLIGALCTALPGSSEWFGGGIIAYSNDIKRRLLGVPDAVLERHGAVSLETGRAMALGALSALNVDCAISVTGVAGPGGGSAAKPVGTVVIGLALPSELENRLSGLADIKRQDRHVCFAVSYLFSGDREAIRMSTAQTALGMLRDCVRM